MLAADTVAGIDLTAGKQIQCLLQANSFSWLLLMAVIGCTVKVKIYLKSEKHKRLNYKKFQSLMAAGNLLQLLMADIG